MMGTKRKLSGTEYDAFCRHCRRHFHWRPGALRKIKQAFWKRTRAHVKRLLKSSL